MREIKERTLYKHFKGGIVYVVGVAKNTETMENLVVYVHNGKLWARPYNMFISEVDLKKYPDAEQKYRFEEVE